ncbi:MAG: NUDIX hydrolase [Candidatus Omnitrophota bacterium]
MKNRKPSMKKTRSVFKGKLLNVMTKYVKLPNGYTVRLEMIEHPGAALIVPFLSRDRILILKQLRPVIGSYIYELPAGTLDKGESTLSCAKREIIEETGYKAAKFTLLGKIFPVPGYSTEKIIIYKAERMTEVGRQAEKDEVLTHCAVDKRTVKKLFRSGKIVDAKTICALAYCGWL